MPVIVSDPDEELAFAEGSPLPDFDDPFGDLPHARPRRRSSSIGQVPHAPDCECADCVWCEMMMQEEADRAKSAEYAAFMRRERAEAEARYAAMTPAQRAAYAAWNQYADQINAASGITA